MYWVPLNCDKFFFKISQMDVSYLAFDKHIFNICFYVIINLLLEYLVDLIGISYIF